MITAHALTIRLAPGADSAGSPTGRTPDSGGGFKVVDRRLATLLESGADLDELEAQSAAPGKPVYVRELEEKVAFLEKALADREAKMKEIIDAHQAADLEMEQYKSRLRQERQEESERQKGHMVARFIDVADNLERSLAAAAQGSDLTALTALAQGVHLVHGQFIEVLRSLGVEKIDARLAPFNPAHHDAVMMRPATDPSQAGLVLEVLRAGYRRGEQVLRAAQVVVAS